MSWADVKPSVVLKPSCVESECPYPQSVITVCHLVKAGEEVTHTHTHLAWVIVLIQHM